jgi:hypothetical protein
MKIIIIIILILNCVFESKEQGAKKTVLKGHYSFANCALLSFYLCFIISTNQC